MMDEWLDWQSPLAVRRRGAAMQEALAAAETRKHAEMLLRLGYSQEQVLRRCLADRQWAYELGGRDPLGEEVVASIVQGLVKSIKNVDQYIGSKQPSNTKPQECR